MNIQALRALGFAVLLCLAGCGDPIGTPCAIQGSGFHASDDCRYRCLQYRGINCPDGSAVNPHICSGEERCAPGSCPQGQICYHIADPFNEESYCVPADVCGSVDQSRLSQWESDSAAAAQALRLEYLERQRLRSDGPTTKPERVEK